MQNKMPLAHPFLSHSLPASSDRSWTLDLDLDQRGYLKDHCVQDMIIMPGSAFMELALLAASASGPQPILLEDIDFQSVLVLSETNAVSVQVHLAPAADGSLSFHVDSPGDLRHVQIRIPQASAGADLPAISSSTLETIQARCAEQITGQAFYTQLLENGNQYGPFFQGIDRLWRRDGEALGRLRIPDGLLPELSDHYLHPAVLDACTQVLSATHSAPGRTFVLVGCDRMCLAHSLGDLAFSHAYLLEDARTDTDTLVGNVHILNGQGEVVVDLLGIRFRYITYGQPRKGESSLHHHGHLGNVYQ